MTTRDKDRDEQQARDELDDLRARVDCRTVLENGGWDLDAKESTRGAVKYRNGAGRIVIVTHEGKGWFDPLHDKRGDVLALAQYVLGGNLGHARKALRPPAGIAPKPVPMRQSAATIPFDASKAWGEARQPGPGSAFGHGLRSLRLQHVGIGAAQQQRRAADRVVGSPERGLARGRRQRRDGT